MKTRAIDLRTQMKTVMSALEKNEPVIVTYHGVDKAKIVPIEEKNENDIQSITNHSFFGLYADRNPDISVEVEINQFREPRHAL